MADYYDHPDPERVAEARTRVREQFLEDKLLKAEAKFKDLKRREENMEENTAGWGPWPDAPENHNEGRKIVKDGYPLTAGEKQESSIVGNIEAIEKQLAIYENNVSILSDRLSLVLHNNIPTDSTQERACKYASSTLGEKLSSIEYRLTDYNTRLRDLTDALDL